MDDLHSLSDSISALARSAAARLFHVPSSLGGRTALGFDGKRLLVPAFDAEEGESLEILGPGGEKLSARVAGFDPKLSLAVLELAKRTAVHGLRPYVRHAGAGFPGSDGGLPLSAGTGSPSRSDPILRRRGERTPTSRPTAPTSPDSRVPHWWLPTERSPASW